MGCVTDTTTSLALRISPLEDGVIASKYSVHSTLVVVQRSRSGDPVRDVRCDRHLETLSLVVIRNLSLPRMRIDLQIWHQLRAAQKTTMDFELLELALGLYKSLAVPHCS